MTEQQILNLVTNTSPWAAGLIAVITLGFRASGIIDRFTEFQKVRNEGKKHDAEAQVTASAGAAETIKIAVEAMKEVVVEQRKFNAERLDNMLQGMRLLEGRVAEQDKLIEELKEELEDKNDRIEELERLNKHQQVEIDTLRAQLNKKNERLSKKADKADA